MRERSKQEKPQEKPLLSQTLDGLDAMQRWLQSLYQDEYPHNPQMFAVMAQGPIAQMRDLLDDIEWLMEDMGSRQLPKAADPQAHLAYLIEAETLLEAA